jgi:hypothetical protein
MSNQVATSSVSCFLAPVSDTASERALERVRRLVGEAQVWGFGPKLAARKYMRPGDRICFYATGTGVVASAVIAEAPRNSHDGRIGDPIRFPWVASLRDVRMFERPVLLTRDLRKELDAFSARDPDELWSWFVQFAHSVSAHDFLMLTGAHPERSEDS